MSALLRGLAQTCLAQLPIACLAVLLVVSLLATACLDLVQLQAKVNDAASKAASVKARLGGPPKPVPLAEAAVRAAQPYYSVMNKAFQRFK